MKVYLVKSVISRKESGEISHIVKATDSKELAKTYILNRINECETNKYFRIFDIYSDLEKCQWCITGMNSFDGIAPEKSIDDCIWKIIFSIEESELECEPNQAKDDEVKFMISCKMKKRWVDHFCSFLKEMERYGDIGHSGIVKFYADGDGDFRPQFDMSISYEKKIEMVYLMLAEEVK